MNVILEAIQYLLEQFGDLPSGGDVKAYWVLPTGEPVDVEYARHSEYVLDNLKEFGLTDKKFKDLKSKTSSDDPAEIVLHNLPSVEVHVYDDWKGRRNLDVLGVPASIKKHALLVLKMAKSYFADTIRIDDIRVPLGQAKSMSRAEFAASYV